MTPKLLSAVVLIAALATAKTPIQWETGVVVFQNLGSQTVGAVVAPVGTAIVGAPIRENTNVVVIDTAHYRYTLTEPNLGGPILFRRSYSSNALILPVNGTVQFYRDGDWFIFMDSKHKKHRFSMAGMVQK